MRHGTEIPYRWTTSRVVLGMFITLTAAAVVSVMGWQVLAQDAAPGGRPVVARTASRAPLFDLSNLTVPASEILSGGPGKDGIPALTDPAVVPVADAGFLALADRVIGVRIGDEARAYPLRLLMWHEAVNDSLAGVPIAVIYCPLCDSVSVIDRRLDGRTYTFGISGLLLNSNVLLYDRTDDALWSQVGLTAISGPNVGRTLRHLPWELAAFGGWRTANPKATVVTFDTGYDRAYGQPAYGDYFRNDQLLYPLVREDRRLPRKDPIVGVKIGATTRAYPVRAILKATDGIVRDTIEGQEIVLQADRESLTVRVVEAPPEAVVVYTFWFAWGAFHPETEIYDR